MVVAKFATTTQHGAIEGKTQNHLVDFYNLDMIISVGYRVHSYRGVQFRMWATKVLKEYIVKGFALNDDLLKRAGGGNYFDEYRHLTVSSASISTLQNFRQRNTDLCI